MLPETDECVLLRAAQTWLRRVTAVLLFAVSLSGCSRRKTDQEAVDQFFTDNPKAKRMDVARFAGRVTIDGLPPEKKPNTRLFILLADPAHFDRLPMRRMAVAEDGSFSFTTYLAGDGVPVGKYVVEFVQLRRAAWPCSTGGRHWPRLRGPG